MDTYLWNNKIAIISVGTELVLGQTVNTNATYLSQQLNTLGFDVLYHYTAGDNPERLSGMIRFAFQDCDMVITTGGLGPTQDDLTKEIVTKVMGDQLVPHEPTIRRMEAMYARQGWEITANNYKQWNLPSRADVFDNEGGTAPGFALEMEGKRVICLPGPPREMKAIYEASVLPWLEERSGGALYFRDIRCFDIGESQLETDLLPLIEGQTDPTFATYAKEGESFLRVASKASTREEARGKVDRVLPRIRELIGAHIYSEDGEDLPQVVGRMLMEQGVTLSAAESCTGGLFTASIASIPGISRVLERGIVTYSNRAKMEELGVSEATLKEHGAVSRETAAEMAEGLAEKTGSDLAIAVTGVAGPSGGSEDKPVGLAYIGIRWKDVTRVVRRKSRNINRRWNQNSTMLAMMVEVYQLLKENEETL